MCAFSVAMKAALHPEGMRLHRTPESCPVSLRVSKRLITLINIFNILFGHNKTQNQRQSRGAPGTAPLDFPQVAGGPEILTGFPSELANIR